MSAPTIGAIVGVAFGCAWGIAGATGLPASWRAPLVVLSIIVSTVLITTLAISGAKGQPGAFRSDVYGVAVALEVIGIVAAVLLLKLLGVPQFLTPAIGFIVGLHFLGLWRATDQPSFAWIALAMCSVCGLAVLMPAGNGDIDIRRAVAGLGSALVLWASGIATLR